ncbi:Ca2+-binding RTX toxin-like protein [Amaricoccus macauensis]|uniref:Ca2+-binding RTX toxin-like protein n=1 Tax=Amaricoccus macauensis TaxID=57001 RepID=A0A840SVA5_9RHOB|nr:hypothetical protein [Amaricoccus macauensis]MBB5223081.1 Ca2+-binding RTX toxin-like protein [Amaricoccus macauensis]
MVSFGANGSFISGTAINRWDPAVTTSLAGLWTRSNALALLADDGSHVLTGDNRSEAIIYDLSLSGKGNISGTFQRFANTFTTIDLGEGNDLLDLTVHPTRNVPAYLTPVTAIGGAGADKIWAGYGADVIYGDTSNSSLITINISLFQSGFADQIYGGDGSDTIYGDYGALDFANVSLGSFRFGDDYVNGGNGNDLIYGDYGDVLIGDYASSLGLTAASLLAFGNDSISGDAGNDTIYGDSSNNSLAGLGAGQDTINGGAGNDELWGDYPALLATGTRDFFVFAPGGGADTIKDFHQDNLASSLAGYNDKIDLTAYAASGIHNIGDLSITYSGGDATINLGGGDTIRVEGPDNLTAPGILGNPLHSTDFIFG